MTTVTATPDLVNSPPRVLLNVSGAGTAGFVQIARVDESGTSTVVRTAGPAALISGAWVGWDYEAPFGRPVTYVATPSTGTAATSAPVTVAATVPWLIHPGIPGFSCQLTIKTFESRTFASSSATHYVLGRSTPVRIGDGVRKAAATSMILKTGSYADADDLENLFSDEATLLLQAVYPDGRPIYEWVSAGDVTVDRVSPVYAEERRVWTVPYTVQSRPVGNLQPQRTWADVISTYATWDAVMAAYPTWTDLIVGTATQAPTVIGGTGGTADDFTATLGAGTVTVAGSAVTDSGSAGVLLPSTHAVDNGNGTVTVA